VTRLLEVENLHVSFPLRGGRAGERFHAVQGVSFEVERGQSMGLVGESGSGKSTVANALLRLISPPGRVEGVIRYEGDDVLPLSPRDFRPYRKRIQMVFQDPIGSLNPRMTVGKILREPLELHLSELGRKEQDARIEELLEEVDLPVEAARRYPHEFSGGQRQRIGIARALAVEPEFLVLDEPVSALDVSVQAQVVNLLSDLAERKNLTYLFIAHDLALVQHFADHVLVMHHGKIVESASAEKIYSDPQHEYTRALLSAVPRLDL